MSWSKEFEREKNRFDNNASIYCRNISSVIIVSLSPPFTFTIVVVIKLYMGQSLYWGNTGCFNSMIGMFLPRLSSTNCLPSLIFLSFSLTADYTFIASFVRATLERRKGGFMIFRTVCRRVECKKEDDELPSQTRWKI